MVIGKRKNVDMTNGNIYKLLIEFSIPLILGDLFQQFYNLTDTWVIGNYASNYEYAAVGACSHIMNIIIKTSIGLASGVGIVISKNFGRGDKDAVKRCAFSAAAIAFVCSILFTFVGLLIIPGCLRMTSVQDEIYDYAKSYLTIIFAFVSAQIIYNIFAGILRAVGDSKKPFLYLATAAVINVILDLLFVIRFGWGIKGVAWATVIAQIVSAILITIELFSTTLWVKVSLKDRCYDKDLAIEMIRLGVPTALQMAIINISNVFIQSYINGLGTNFLSGHSTFNKIEQFLFKVSNSIGIAVMTFVSQNLGAGNVGRVRKGTRAGSVIVAVYSVTVIAIVTVFAPQIVGFFNSDPEVVYYGALSLRIVSPFYVIEGISHICMNAIRGAGNTKGPLFLQLLFNIAFRQVGMYIVKNYLGYTAEKVLLVQPISWILFSLAMFILYMKTDFESKVAKE